MTKFRWALVALIFLWLSLATAAFADDWKIREVSGAVRVTLPARNPASATVGQTLPIGTSITTGGNGRATMTNGQQRIVVGPNSRTTLAPEQGGVTRILQDLGSALFQVDRQGRPHFRVETPLLAAVVKGTTFTVSVDPLGDRVHVAEGLVEVRSNSSNVAGDVAAGATGVVTRDQPATVDVTTPSASVTIDSAALNIAPIDYSTASGGLVENAALPPASGPATGAVPGPTAPAPTTSSSPGPAPGTGNNGNGNGNGNGGTAPASGTGNNGNGNGNGNDGTGPAPGTGNNGNGNGNGGTGPAPGTGNNGNGNGNDGTGPAPGTGNNGNGNGSTGPAPGTGNNGNGNGNGGTRPAPGTGNNGNGNGGTAPAPGTGNNGNGNGGAGPAPGTDTGNGNGGTGPGNGSGNGGNGRGGNGNGGGNGAPLFSA